MKGSSASDLCVDLTLTEVCCASIYLTHSTHLLSILLTCLLIYSPIHPYLIRPPHNMICIKRVLVLPFMGTICLPIYLSVCLFTSSSVYAYFPNRCAPASLMQQNGGGAFLPVAIKARTEEVSLDIKYICMMCVCLSLLTLSINLSIHSFIAVSINASINASIDMHLLMH